MSKPCVKAIFFDLGDTLLNFGKIDTFKPIYQSARCTYDYLLSEHQPAGSFLGYFLTNLLNLKWRILVSFLTKRDFDSLSTLQKTGQRQGINLTESQWAHFNWLWYLSLQTVAQVENDLVQTLMSLQQRGLKLGIVSNTFIHASALDKHLQALGILDFFPIRLYSYQFDFRKPDKRIFLEAAHQVNIRPEHIMYVGDRINNDIRPALNLNMIATLKRAHSNKGKTVPLGAHVIEHLRDLPGLVNKINGDNELI